MKKIRIVCGTTLFAAALLLAAGCASTPSNAEPTVQAPTRIVGAEGVPMPEWVRNIPKAEDVMYFVGEGRSGKTPTAKKNSALQDAARQIGDWKASTIKSAIKDYVQEAGETGNTQSLELLEVTSIARAQADTSGIRQSLSWVNQKEEYIILVEYPKADLKNSFKSSLNEFVRNESAAYAEFKADEAFRLLEAEMDKQ
ncbi:MAG: hypothetical protein HDR51_08380 [Treponema sp.]|nr:hypothetical protein [Treponema sp.]MBD5412742.1 hypothetical protein [Treponema sp.]